MKGFEFFPLTDNYMSKNILLVEDDSLLSEMYTMILQDEGFNVSHVRDGRAALLRTLDDIDLVLLDIRIPEIDGLEVLRFYREHGFKRPIIVLTNSPQVNLTQALEMGADGFMIKSHSDINDVLNVVQKHLA
ncbi:MAG: hypothetical protein A3J48_03605 [Candidatus Doudnabacteria bacterium RIFCSPHIGHO2_02_FULL_46_11]|uniref:Response regulatory domain-containing protein n=1 Tax=Candidatus Doudnabacteria bacterium RIFCSPHIGHO2_02_FULL_46_11 TaxID=1817832 RepID=A0A1F5P462_9BACT|nr:MAG: hypothetical protein A3J48_03605 [Candidatus Doudnabacteria bacterium RIFCSPHIGHO2_02_FULL_46_11]